MQKELLKRIIREETRRRKRRTDAALIAVRKRITLAVAREIVRQSPLAERYWNIFVDATEAESNLWAFLALNNVSQFVADTENIEQLLLLYERWQRMCEFLIDEYDRLPAQFTGKWAKDALIEIAGCVSAAKEKMFSDFAERDETMLEAGHFSALKGMIDWTRLVALGEDSYRKFMAESNDVMRSVAEHPRFAVVSGFRRMKTAV